MAAHIKHQMNCASRIIQPKVLYAGVMLALGVQMFPFTAHAAFFESPDSEGERSLLQTAPETEGNKTIEIIDAVKELNKLENTYNQEAIRLTKQGLEKLKTGDKQQGLKELEQAWSLDRRLLPAGIALGFNHLQNKEYEQALQFSKQIQSAVTQDYHGLGYSLEGMVYAGKGEFDKADAAFKKAVKVMPTEKYALFNIAILAERKNNYSDAKAYLQKIIDIEPTHSKALEQLAKIEMVLGNKENATAFLNKAINAHPEETSPVIALAKNYSNAGNFQQVLALTENKTDPVLLEMRGKAYLSLGETEKAKQVFEGIVEKMPQSAAASYVLADFFAKTGNIPEATKQIQNTLNKDSKFLPARIGEIKTLFFSGKVPEANQAGQALIKEFGNQAEVLSVNGWLSMQQNNYEQAEKYFGQIPKDNVDTEITLWRVKSLWIQKKYDEGFEILKNWIKKYPQDVSAQMALADGYMGRQKKIEAKEAYLKALKMQPNIAPAYNNLAWLVEGDDIKQAIGYAETALNLEKENPRLLDTLGMLLVKDGQIEKGVKFLQEAVKKGPDDTELLYHLAEVLVMQNKLADASPVLDKLGKSELSAAMQERVKVLQKAAGK